MPLPTGEVPDRVAPLLAETGPRVLASSLEQLETAVAVAPPMPTDRFRTAVRIAALPSDSEVSHLSKELARKYVRDLRALSVI